MWNWSNYNVSISINNFKSYYLCTKGDNSMYFRHRKEYLKIMVEMSLSFTWVCNLFRAEFKTMHVYSVYPAALNQYKIKKNGEISIEKKQRQKHAKQHNLISKVKFQYFILWPHRKKWYTVFIASIYKVNAFWLS